MFETFSRSWEIAKQTFSVIGKDKEILIFPVLSSIFSIIFFALMVVPYLMGAIVREVIPNDATALLYFGVVFAFYLGISFISTFFNVAVVYCAKKRFEGGDPTFSEGLHAAFSRIHLIILWSLLSATVGTVLRMIEDAGRRSSGIGKLIFSAIAGILGLAWAIVSVFVVPALVIDNVGPIDALKHSVAALKKTWGESLIRVYGLGAAKGLFIFAGFLVFAIPAAAALFAFQSIVALLVIIGLFLLYLTIVSLIFGTADTVFNTALYLYAKNGTVPHAYTPETMKHAFASRKGG